MKNKIRYIETSLYYNKHINYLSPCSSLYQDCTSGIKLGHWDQCWQAIWNSWEFQTGKERDNAANNYSCLCPVSDQASSLICRYQKPNITREKKTLPRRKEKLNVTRSRRIFTPFRVITNEKKACERSEHSIHGYQKSFFPGTKFSSLRPRTGPCHCNDSISNPLM